MSGSDVLCGRMTFEKKEKEAMRKGKEERAEDKRLFFSPLRLYMCIMTRVVRWYKAGTEREF